MLRSAGTGLIAVALTLAPHVMHGQSCPGDLNGDGEVTINEIIVAVNSALTGCSSPSPTPPASASATATAKPTTTPTRTTTPTPTPRFVDNGDGTITDHTTGLTWAKQSDDASITDKDSLYTWTATYPNGLPTGTLFSTYIAALNNGRFGGHRDWRIPTDAELRTILDTATPRPGAPLVAAAFNVDCRPGCRVTQCSCTTANSYWTVTTVPQATDRAWYVSFQNGATGTALKTQQLFGRAVRGDS